MWTTFIKTLPQTVVGLVLLAALTVFGYTGHVSASDTYNTLLAFIALVGASGLYVLASTWANSNAMPQLIVGVAIIGALVALGLHDVFTSTQLQGIMMLLLTGAAVGTGGVVVASAAAIKAASEKKDPAEVPSQ